MNGIILPVTEGRTTNGNVSWSVRIRRDGGGEIVQEWGGPTLVRITADATSSAVHFPNARVGCREAQ